MTTFLGDAIAIIDTMLAPVTPAGVTGIQFLSVFFIVYAITFLLVGNIEFLKKNKAAQAMLSLVIAYFTASSAFSVILITKLFPNVGVVTIILVSFIAVIAIIPSDKRNMTMGPILTLAGVGLVIYLTWTGIAGTLNLEGLKIPTLTRNEWYGITFLAIFVGIILLIYFMGREKGPRGDKRKLGNFMKFLFGVEDYP